MPSLYTHQMIAKRVFEKMDKPNYIKNNYNEFLLGCIGLEMFHYHKLFIMLQNSSLEQLGSLLKFAEHKDFLLTLIEYSKGDIANMVYVLGFVTNYAADRTIRPYVHSRTEKAQGGGDVVRQAKFEQALDVYLYKEYELEDTVVQGDFLDKIKRKELRHVSGLLSSACRAVSNDKKIWRKDIVAAYDDTRAFTKRAQKHGDDAAEKMRVQEIMIGKVNRLTPFVPPKIIKGNDVFNLAHRTWRAPFEMHKARNESVIDLVEKSVEVSVEIIDRVNEYYLEECELSKVEEMVGNINFNGREME